ncbi:hypothetical protein B0T24DRAFT_128202 [Lasiosphaeria ovina]|uniref:Uncharacterized protein n=1 Tax=Lasiosphaeria ovina TaxID=92902 RepID=A0AAE0JSK2_9PEZI|nr:hypothetical protein B0T24DRAFT_128202 [Lasiosphaeria ovina]
MLLGVIIAAMRTSGCSTLKTIKSTRPCDSLHTYWARLPSFQLLTECGVSFSSSFPTLFLMLFWWEGGSSSLSCNHTPSAFLLLSGRLYGPANQGPAGDDLVHSNCGNQSEGIQP